jgi:hypothetical protein
MERQFYAEVARLDLSLFEDKRFVRDRPCERLGKVIVSENGVLILNEANGETRRRFRRAISSGKLTISIGGMSEDGSLWDGRELLDSQYTPNVLVWLCSWNDVGVFSEGTQRDLWRLLQSYKIETRRRSSS